ncbi:MAG: ISNCY family transposase [PVC group bacterium]|nr:ISNCY family transposase [PVC group bacterium]
MLRQLRAEIMGLPDRRTGKNLTYSMEDIGPGAFSVFFTQSPSFLSFQKTMQMNTGKNNADTIFGIEKIPCDNHIRSILDEVCPSDLYSMFPYIVNAMDEAEYPDSFRIINDNILIALDGTQYFSSDKIHCDNCSVKNHKNGKKTYSHSAVTPVILKPGKNKVIPLDPEFITPQDGHQKQDCENAAAKRWLCQYGLQYKGLNGIILGDDLYSRQPLCEIILKEGFHFISVCKPDSHKTLYEWLADFDKMGAISTKEIRRQTGKRTETDTYRYFNHVPLRDSDDAIEVNWCEQTTTLADGAVIYQNSFVTDLEITEDNVIEIAKAGRARWKIENENNNVLKTKGYNLEHNFGHGKKHLSSTLLTLNLLSFAFHTVLEITDKKYRILREALPARKTFFDDLRALTRYICFENWNDLLNFMLRGLEIENIDSG